MIRELMRVDILLNNVETINQYKVLQYLKNNLNLDEFRLFLYDKDTIKVIDNDDKLAYFRFENDTKEILFLEELEQFNLELEH